MKSVKLDWNKIDQSRLFQGRKTQYLDLTLVDNREGTDKYGNDGFVTQTPTQEERQRKERMPIIGNWKHIPTRRQAPGDRNEQPQTKNYNDPRPEESGDVPF